MTQGQQRTRRAAFTGVTSLIARGVATVANLVSIPITQHYLGSERFGLWLILSMLLNWMNLTDLGLANSLTNLLAAADGQKDIRQAKQAVSSAFWLMVGIAIVLSLTFEIADPLIPWDRLFNVTSDQAKSEVGLAVTVFFIGFILRLPLSIAGRVYTAYQEGYFYQAWNGLSNLLSVGALLVAIQFQVGLPSLVAVFFGTALVGDSLATLHVFGWKWRLLRPQWSEFSSKQAKWLLKTGLQFWVIQISSLLFFQTDLMVVAQMFGASAVAHYGPILKLFTLLGMIQTAFLFPLWPAYGEAFARRDVPWIIRTFHQTIGITLLWSLSTGIILSISVNKILKIWLNQTTTLDLILAMFVMSVLMALGQCIATLLSGLGHIRFQAIVGFAAGIFNLILSVSLGRLIGVSGVCWATAICLLIFPLGIVGTHALLVLQEMKSEFQLNNQL